MPLPTNRTAGSSVTDHVNDHNTLAQFYNILGNYTPGNSPVINAKDSPYNATGDGTTDDKVAIQAALNACPIGGNVVLPAGANEKYLIGSQLIIPPFVGLEATHGNRTDNVQLSAVIKLKSTFTDTAAIRLLDKEEGGYGTENEGVRIRRLTIDCSGTAGTIDGIRATGLVHGVILDNVCIQSAPRRGVSCENYTRIDTSIKHPYSWNVWNCMMWQCADIGYSFQNGQTDCTFLNCESLGCGGDGFRFTACANTQVTSCRAEFCVNGFRLSGAWGTGTGSGGIVMTGCSTDRNTQNGVLIDSTGNVVHLISGLMCRRDGRNGNVGGSGFAGLRVTSATTPVIVTGITCFPGVDDDSSGTSSPQYGVRSSASTFVQVSNGYLHAATAGVFDDGDNSVFLVGPNVGVATGSTAAPTRSIQATSWLKQGVAKINAGTKQWGIPNTGITNVPAGGTAQVANTVRYLPLRIDRALTITAWELEITTGPGSAGNLRVGLYTADTDYQPTGAPVYDSGAVAVANGFTGVKTLSGLSVLLNPGSYLVAFNADQAMTLRQLIGPTPWIADGLGANAAILRVEGAQTFGAFPNPGTKWNVTSNSTAGAQHIVVFQWTE